MREEAWAFALSVAVIIFSRDRPMQLHALLDSLWENATMDPLGTKPTIIFTFSDEHFHDGYRNTVLDHQGWCEFVREEDFQRDYMDALPESGYVVHFVDDDVVHGRANLQHAAFELDRDDQLLTFSLRLGLNTTYCYSLDQPQPLPASIVNIGGMLFWRFVGAQHDAAYPFSLDGHVLRVDDIRQMLQASIYRSPNELEQTLASRAWMRSSQRPKMACYARSCVTGVPANVVTTTHNNRYAMGEHTAEWLNQAYLTGWRIDWRRMNWSAVDAAHADVPFVFCNQADKEAA